MPRRNFPDTFRDIRAGDAQREVEEKLTELVQAVDATGKTGSVTIKIVVAKTKNVKDAMTVKADITAKIPQSENTGTIMFNTPEGQLQRQHPRQTDLPGIRAVNDATTIDQATGEVIARQA